jgi:hypothetical protein
MRIDLVLLAFSLTMPWCLEARAEVTYLSCSGTMRVIRAGMSSPDEPWTFAITVDTDRKIIMVDDYDPVPFTGEYTIVFMPSTRLISGWCRSVHSPARRRAASSNFLRKPPI